MRNRSNSGIRLDYFQRLVNRTILRHQNPATGLITSRGEDVQHSWVRDNVYSIYAVWGLALAYRKTADLDEDRAKSFELEKSVVMLMRGLLRCMMMQCEKLEAFKKSPLPTNALHAKYSTLTGQTVVDDHHWGHLQIDATALYLLTLAQMTASGLNIIYTLDEVAFIQNLVFYIETAYRTPDYGIWERGDKTNHGLPELNSSSIGMAKAALEAINELDLFSARGGSPSVIHVLPDEAQQCQAILMSMLPRESNSKEVDASLLSTIGFPAFAVDDVSVVKTTKETIEHKLDGKYGCRRFLRDGYKTPKEDSHRLYYNRCELVQFENIESQWPLFFCFYILDGLFMNDKKQVEEYKSRLDSVLQRGEDGLPLVPELYSVPLDEVEKEKAEPNSVQRVPNGQLPHMWGQSLYILGRLMYEGFISPGELDPLNRRQISEDKPDVVVQVVILAEDTAIAHQLAQHGIHVQTISATHPIQVHPARVLSQIFSRLGKNKRLGLTGRPSGEIGLLATSKLYTLDNKMFAFIPQFVDQTQFYLPRDVSFLVNHFETDLDFLGHNWRSLGRPLIVIPVQRSMLGHYTFMDLQQFYVVLDTNLLIDIFRTEVAFLKKSWKGLGRPTITFCVTNTLLDHQRNFPQALIGTMKKLQSGYISGTRVHLGKLNDFVNTSCITRIDFLRDRDDPTQREDQIMDFIDDIMAPSCPRPHLLATAGRRPRRPSRSASGQAVSGIVRRSRSIQIDADQVPELLEHLARARTASISRSSFSTSTADQDQKISVLSQEAQLHPEESTHSESRRRKLSVASSPLNLALVSPSTEGYLNKFAEEQEVNKSIPEGGTRPASANSDPSYSPASSSRIRFSRPGTAESHPDPDREWKKAVEGYRTFARGLQGPETVGQLEEPGTSHRASRRSSSMVHYISRMGLMSVATDSANFQSIDEDEGSQEGSLPNSPPPSQEEHSEPTQFLHLKSVTDTHFDLPHSPSHSQVNSPIMQHKQIVKVESEANDLNVDELLVNLKQSESLQEQADIIHYLHAVKPLDWDTGLDTNRPCTVHDLLTELYEKAGHWKQWWLVRHTAGMLGKRVEDLAIAVTDLLVRQKQLSVGMPPNRENIIISPLPPDMLAKIIFESCDDDFSTASLTQEVLIYLAMFIRTEPKLFNEMLRLRVGLIIQVMASEMARTLKCSGDEASDHLLNLSPFEMKTLLHHILSGKEFNISTTEEPSDVQGRVSIRASTSKRDMDAINMRMSRRDKVVSQRDLNIMSSPVKLGEDDATETDERLGQWSRRRRLDGALNKVPVGFYPRIWRVLRRCPGLVIDITTLHRSLTEEMTEGEFKFALELEYALNQLPEPEYRQLMVEAMVILATIVENDNGKINLNYYIRVDDIVAEANQIFIKEQGMTDEQADMCAGARGICQHLYDSAPSGRHGSMTFLCRALAKILQLPVNNGELECCIS